MLCRSESQFDVVGNYIGISKKSTDGDFNGNTYRRGPRSLRGGRTETRIG